MSPVGLLDSKPSLFCFLSGGLFPGGLGAGSPTPPGWGTPEHPAGEFAAPELRLVVGVWARCPRALPNHRAGRLRARDTKGFI